MPPWKEEIRRFWNRYIWKHGTNDTHHFVFHLGIWESLNSYCKIALYEIIPRVILTGQGRLSVVIDNPQLLSRTLSLIPGRNLDGPSFAKPDNGRDQSQHKVPSEGIKYQCNFGIGILNIPPLKTKTCGEIGEIFSCMWP